MSVPVLVRSSMRTWDYALLLVAGVGAFIGGCVVFNNGDKFAGVMLEVVGGLCVLASVVGLRWRIRRRQWIRLDDQGFTLIDRNGDTDYVDQQVRSIALRLKQNFSEGIAKSLTQTVLIWLGTSDADDHEVTKIELKTTFKPEAGSPLSVLIERLSKQVLDRARQILSDGSPFSGDGWSIGQRNLVVAAKPEPLHCSLDEISATGVVDDKLCLWRIGVDEVWTRIDINSVNAYVLKWLIDEQLAKRPGTSESAPSGDSFGRVIFERRPPAWNTVVLGLGAIALLSLAAFLFVAPANNPGRAQTPRMIVATCISVLAIACGVGVVHCRRAVFRCHQFGVVKQGLGLHRSLRYEHVESFTYKATRHYHNGVYVATAFVLDLIPDAAHKSQRIRYSVSLKHNDSELDNLRDQIAVIIGARMQRSILEGRQVQWTPGLTFDGDSLIYSAAGLFGRKPPITIPLADIATFTMDKGQCYLFRADKKKAIVQEGVDARNFFPGFHCMLALIHKINSTNAEVAKS